MNKLSKAPLQEVIFELLWDIEFNPQGNPFDPNFELAQGIFAKRVSDRFPERKRTLPEGIPLKIYPKAIHQFWKGSNIWPVVQLGPGILAINDTEVNYEWGESFFPMIKSGIDDLEESYEQQLMYKNVSLRYIDAVEIETKSNNILDFINSKFNVRINNEFNYSGNISSINFNQTFDLEDGSKLSFIISDGRNKLNKPALIWQTYIFSNSKKTKQEIISWVNKAHEITSNTFKDSIKTDFYDSFKQNI